MVAIMETLETRYFYPRQVICKELEQALEFYFVQQGRYNIGYEINKVIKYRLQFGPRTVIGAFNVAFNKRHQYFIQASAQMNCFAIRKVSWEKLSMLYQYFSECMKINFIYNYSIHIRRPMISKKHKDKQAY